MWSMMTTEGLLNEAQLGTMPRAVPFLYMKNLLTLFICIKKVPFHSSTVISLEESEVWG